jgi:hypothetical protein
MQFSEYKNQTFTPYDYKGTADPFNFPMPGRADAMNLSAINQQKDGMKTTTFRFTTGRQNSTNLNTNDIDGKLLLLQNSSFLFIGAQPRLHGSKPAGNKHAWNLSNADIDCSSPRNLHVGLNKTDTNMVTSDILGA